MTRISATALTLFAAIMLFPISALCAEGLFDTKAAAGHMDKGFAHLKTRNYDAAIREFEEASLIQPDAEAFYCLGYAYYMKSRTTDGGEREKALENFKHAYEIDPNFTPSKFKPEDMGAVKAAPVEKGPEQLEKMIEKMEAGEAPPPASTETATPQVTQPETQPRTAETTTAQQ